MRSTPWILLAALLGCDDPASPRSDAAVDARCDPSAPDACGGATHCIVQQDQRTCIDDGARHGRCRAQDTACDPGLVCVTDVYRTCEVPRAVGEVCEPGAGPLPCVAGSRCVGRGADALCRVDGTLDGQCASPGRVCDAGLVCTRAERCRRALAAGAVCDRNEDACGGDARCAEIDGAWRCAASGAVGGACRAGAPRCDAGLGCVGRVCVVASGLGGACNATTRACAEGLGCLDGRCVTAGALDRPCRFAAPPCDDGLSCNALPSLCVPSTVGAEDGRCRTGAMPCDAGLYCDVRRFCVRPVAPERCGFGYFARRCDGDARCSRAVTGEGRCVTTLGRACGSPEMQCDASQICRADTRTCDVALSLGAACTGGEDCGALASCHAIGDGSACVANGARGGRCRDAAPRCEPSLSCVAQPDRVERCVRVAMTNERCGVDERDTTCAAGLMCRRAMGEWRCGRDAGTPEVCDVERNTGCAPTTTCSVFGTGAARCRTDVDDAEPNDAPASAQALVGSEIRVRGSLRRQRDRDCFALDVPSGGSIAVLSSVTSGESCGALLSVTLWRADTQLTAGAGGCPTIDPSRDAMARGLSAGRYAVCVEMRDPLYVQLTYALAITTR